MARMARTPDEYKSNDGWSSHYFAKNAILLMDELQSLGSIIKIGRTVIHINLGNRKLKAYVHYNGRSEEYATITDNKGQELFTAHHSDFNQLSIFVKDYLCHSN